MATTTTVRGGGGGAATTMSVFLERQAAQQEAAMKADLEQRQRDIQEAIENELESFYDSDSEEDDDQDDGGDNVAVAADVPNARRRVDDDDQLSESSINDDNDSVSNQGHHRHPHKHLQSRFGNVGAGGGGGGGGGHFHVLHHLQVRPPIEGSSLDDDEDVNDDSDEDEAAASADGPEEDGGFVGDDDDKQDGADRDVPIAASAAAAKSRAVAFAPAAAIMTVASRPPALAAAPYPLALLNADHPGRHLILASDATSRSTAQLYTLSPETTGCGLSSVEYSAGGSIGQHLQLLGGAGGHFRPQENILPPRPVQRVDVGVSVVPENQRDLDQLDILYRARGRHIEELKAQLLELQETSGREARLLKHKLALGEASRESLEKAKEASDGKLVACNAQMRDLQAESDRRQDLSARLLAENEQLRRSLETATSQTEALSAQLSELNTAGTIGRVRDQQENFIQSLRSKKDEEIYFLRDRVDRLLTEAAERQAEADAAKSAAALTHAQDTAQLLQANEHAACLTQQLRDSQRRCQEVLAGTSSEEVRELRQQLAQREVAKAITDEMNAALQEEITDLREQLGLYEAAERLGALPSKSPSIIEGAAADAGVAGGRDATSTSMPNVGPTADRDKGVACLKAELLRCQDLYKQKREKVTELQKELIQLKKVSYEGRLRCERAELALAEHRERTAALEARLRAVQKRLDEVTEPGAVELRLRKQLEVAGEQKAMLEEDLAERQRQLQASTASAQQLAEQCAQLRADFASAWDRAEREKHDDLERIQRTCQEHFELCRERMREELLAAFAAEKRQLTGEHERRVGDMQGLVAQLGEERRQLEDQLRLAARPPAPPPPPPPLSVAAPAVDKRSSACQTDGTLSADPDASEERRVGALSLKLAAQSQLHQQTPIASGAYHLDALAEQETELGRRLQACYLQAISRIRDEVVNHVTDSQERSERRMRRAQRNVCARFALHLRRSVEEKFGCEDSELSVDSVLQLLNQSLNHTLNRTLPSPASHSRHSQRQGRDRRERRPSANGGAFSWDESTTPTSSHSSPSAHATASAGAAAATPVAVSWTTTPALGGSAATPVAPPRPARASATARSSSAAAAAAAAAETSTPAEKDSAAVPAAAAVYDVYGKN